MGCDDITLRSQIALKIHEAKDFLLVLVAKNTRLRNERSITKMLTQTRPIASSATLRACLTLRDWALVKVMHIQGGPKTEKLPLLVLPKLL